MFRPSTNKGDSRGATIDAKNLGIVRNVQILLESGVLGLISHVGEQGFFYHEGSTFVVNLNPC